MHSHQLFVWYFSVAHAKQQTEINSFVFVRKPQIRTTTIIRNGQFVLINWSSLMLLSLCPVSFFTSVAQFNYINDFVTLHLVLWINKFYDFVQVVAPPWEWKVAQSAIHKSQNRRQTLRQSTLVCIASRHGASPAQLICTYRWTWDEWKQWQAWLHKEILQVTNGWRSTSSVTDMGHHHGTGTNWDRKKIRRERYVANVFTECWAAK